MNQWLKSKNTSSLELAQLTFFIHARLLSLSLSLLSAGILIKLSLASRPQHSHRGGKSTAREEESDSRIMHVREEEFRQDGYKDL